MLRKTLCLGLVAIVATLGLSVESLGWGGAHYSYHYGGGYGGGGYHYSYHAGGYGGGGYHYGGGGSGGGGGYRYGGGGGSGGGGYHYGGYHYGGYHYGSYGGAAGGYHYGYARLVASWERTGGRPPRWSAALLSKQITIQNSNILSQ